MPLLRLPAKLEPLYRESLASLAAGETKAAAAGAARLVQECEGFDGGWLLLSQVAQTEGNVSLAIRAATQSISRNPTNALHYVQLGRCLLAMGNSVDALKTAEKAERFLAASSEELDALSVLYMGCGEYERALPLQRRAVERDPSNPAYVLMLAVICQTLGNIEKAAEAYETVLRLDPNHPGALAGLARLRTASEDNNIVDELRRQLSTDREISDERETRLRYALAKQLEDLGQYPDSFAELEQASALKRESLDYSVDEDEELFATLRDIFANGPDVSTDASESNAPIFVVGMPRSGTTLVERIITSHPEVTSAGELHDFGLAVLDTVKRESPGRYLDAGFAREIATADKAAIGKRYLERTRRYVDERPHFVDKLPMNLLYAGFISEALPNAKIIQLDRHPLDVCFSNFKILFRSGYEYSYRLEELADFYIAYRRLSDHWQRVLGDNYLVVSYEALIENQEEESRRIIGHVGLDWTDDCLRFYENRQAAATASSAQVRTPIYSKAVKRWKHYEAELKPVIERLAGAGITTD